MNKGKSAIYKYSGKSLPGFFGNLLGFFKTFILFVAISVFIAYVANKFFALKGLLISLAVLFFVFFVLYKPRPRIAIFQNHFIVGDKVFFYDNIESISINEARQECTVKSRGKNTATITSAGFPTNARKDHKIRLNKEKKFYKVVIKILNGYLKCNPNGQLRIDEPDRLKHFLKA